MSHATLPADDMQSARQVASQPAESAAGHKQLSARGYLVGIRPCDAEGKVLDPLVEGGGEEQQLQARAGFAQHGDHARGVRPEPVHLQATDTVFTPAGLAGSLKGL